jgi:hypothetical protein
MNHSLFPRYLVALLAVLLFPLSSSAQAPAAPAAARQEITVPSETLAQYIGNYQLAPNFVLAVTLENGQLMTQATGQAKVPVYAETETKFFLKVVEASIEFQKDANGAVTGLVLQQNGQTVPAQKQ